MTMRLLLRRRRRPVLIVHSLLHLQYYTTTITSTAFQPRPNLHLKIKPKQFSNLSNKALLKTPSSSSSLSTKIIMCKIDNQINSNNNNNNNNIEINKDSLLWEWATHTNESYHNFDPKEAIQIKKALLQWYRTHRRKLPWRGDVGPFDGSTAGINATNKKSSNSGGNSKKGGKKRKMSSSSSSSNREDTKSRQKSIKSFFKKDTSSLSSSDRDTKNDEDANNEQQKQKIQKIEKAIPITGYSVWVSEIMLQQTRVEAVIPYYLKWMESFPTVHDLAKASEEQINSHWAGLGFYRRARLLHQGSKYVSHELNGIMPQTVDELMKISGIGRYTASAIASIAFDMNVPVVDGNVCRVLSRLKGVANHIKSPILKDGLGWDLANQIVNAGCEDEDIGSCAGDVNQAMMELGATYCSPSGTGVDENDPLREFYLSTKIGQEVHDLIQSKRASSSSSFSKDDIIDVINEFVSKANAARGEGNQCAICDTEGISSVLYQIANEINLDDESTKEDAAIIGHANFPTPPPKKNKREEVLSIAALSISTTKTGGEKINDGSDSSTKWLMVKRPNNGLLAGQWEFPSTCIWSSSDKNAKQIDTKPKSKSKKANGKDNIQIPTFTLQQRQNYTIRMLDQYKFQRQDDEEVMFTAATLWEASKYSCQTKIVNKKEPIEHIFSHVRHSMWIEHGHIELNALDNVAIDEESFIDSTYYYKTTDGTRRQFKWMSLRDMEQVGITSAIKKILKEIQHS